MPRFTDELTDQERSVLIMGLTLVAMDGVFGIVTGEPWTSTHLARDFPLLFEMFDELGAPWDHHLDPNLIAQFNALLATEAGKEAVE